MHWRNDKKELPVFALSYNHRAQAFYRADRDFPDNKNTDLVRKRGLKRCRILASWCPPFVLEFLSAQHNKYHKGSGASVIEICKTALRLEASWRASCETTGMSSSNPAYQKSYEASVGSWAGWQLMQSFRVHKSSIYSIFFCHVVGAFTVDHCKWWGDEYWFSSPLLLRCLQNVTA